MSEKSYTHTTVVGVAGISGLLIVHRRIDNLKELSEEVFLRVRARSIYDNSVQVVQLSVTEACLCKRGVSSKGLWSSRFCLHRLCGLFRATDTHV